MRKSIRLPPHVQSDVSQTPRHPNECRGKRRFTNDIPALAANSFSTYDIVVSQLQDRDAKFAALTLLCAQKMTEQNVP